MITKVWYAFQRKKVSLINKEYRFGLLLYIPELSNNVYGMLGESIEDAAANIFARQCENQEEKKES